MKAAQSDFPARMLQDGQDLNSLEAEEFMSQPPITVEEETPVKDVIKRMIKGSVLRVPVVRDGRLVGLISRSDLLDHLVAKRLIVAQGAF